MTGSEAAGLALLLLALLALPTLMWVVKRLPQRGRPEDLERLRAALPACLSRRRARR